MTDEIKIKIPKSAQPPKHYGLKIDCRENTVVQWYNSSDLCKDDRICVERMDTGDFIFTRDDKPFVCIERKRIDDFASSIRDGRYKTQKMELIEYASRFDPPPFLVYLVEQFNIIDDSDMTTEIGKTKISKETVLSAMTKTMFRDGFQIVMTTDVDDSIRWLCKMWSNLTKGEFEGYDVDDSSNKYYDSMSLKLGKRSTSQMKNIDRDKTNSWWMLALANINGISAAKAKQIVERYPDASSLLKAYESLNNDDEKYKLLSNIKVNNRRIGYAASKSVYEHIMGKSNTIIVSTAPPQTAPPQTAPPQTAPPQTAPPQTAPPQTAQSTSLSFSKSKNKGGDLGSASLRVPQTPIKSISQVTPLKKVVKSPVQVSKTEAVDLANCLLDSDSDGW